MKKKLETGVICLLAISMLTGCSSSGELINLFQYGFKYEKPDYSYGYG